MPASGSGEACRGAGYRGVVCFFVAIYLSTCGRALSFPAPAGCAFFTASKAQEPTFEPTWYIGTDTSVLGVHKNWKFIREGYRFKG